MENTVETTVLPINDESNRLGTLIVNTCGVKVYEHTRHNGEIAYFAWETDEARGFMFPTLDNAAAYLGLRKPTGCADYNGEVRLGKCIEKFPNGEIWKHTRTAEIHDFTDYYVWWNNGGCSFALSLADAREMAGINAHIMSIHRSPPTAPKSSYPQNQKGYRPNGVTGKKAAKSA